MRKPIIAGNWKMFKTRDEALEFIYQVNNDLPSKDLVDSVVCAPFTVLRDLVKRQGENLRIGAQNMHFEEKGAFTGEVAPGMLEAMGVSYVVLGHSERREYFNETDEALNKKVKAAFAHNLTPILCCGETLEQREQGITMQVITTQTEKALEGLTAEDVEKVIIAYEPIWAIGTGKTATAEQANDAIMSIRDKICQIYGQNVAEGVIIQYGGSVKSSNAKELFNATGKVLENATIADYEGIDALQLKVIEATYEAYEASINRPLFSEYGQVWATWQNSLLSWSANNPANAEEAYKEVKASFDGMMANFN